MDETEDVIRLGGRALVAQMGSVPGVELHLTRRCAMGLTGEPSPDFNASMLGDDPDAEDFFVRSIAGPGLRKIAALRHHESAY